MGIVITDGRSRSPPHTQTAAHLCHDSGISLTAIGIAQANYEELKTIAGDQSRVYDVNNFDELVEIEEAVKETTCKGIVQLLDISSFSV